VKPEANATSKSLKESGDKTLQRLKTLKGAQFDKAYVDNEVTYHQTVLDALDKTLIPSEERRAESALDKRPAGLRGASGARQAPSGRARQVAYRRARLVNVKSSYFAIPRRRDARTAFRLDPRLRGGDELLTQNIPARLQCAAV
jgi:Domain of unknown function (DUF4142)